MDSPTSTILCHLSNLVNQQRIAPATTATQPAGLLDLGSPALVSLREPYPPLQLTSQVGPTGFARQRFALAHIPRNLTAQSHSHCTIPSCRSPPRSQRSQAPRGPSMPNRAKSCTLLMNKYCWQTHTNTHQIEKK